MNISESFIKKRITEYGPPGFALAIMGPTASGKTDTAFHVARISGGEIISADSKQVYKGMEIASAQPPKEMLRAVKHHFISELSPEETFSAGDFAGSAGNVIMKLLKKARLPVIAGGSGLYLRALTDGFYEGDIRSDDVRDHLNNLLHEKGKEHLYELLKQVDPESARTTSANFSRRVFRALEVFYISGKKLSDIKKENVHPGFVTKKFYLDVPREKLYERINRRVDNMLNAGLIEEVASLMESGYHYRTHNSLNTVGIKEVTDHLEGKLSYDEMVFLMKRNTRRFAKRQMTWFRKEQDLCIVECDLEGNDENLVNPEETALRILDIAFQKSS